MDWHTGKIALVTGGGRGIGRGIAHCLARDGADIAIVDLILENAQAVASEVAGRGRRGLPVEADVSTREGAERAVAAALAHFGRIDILINNAGVGGAPGWPGRQYPSEEDWDVAWAVNVRSHALMTELISPGMIAQGGGKIVYTASIGGWLPSTHQAHYGASKAADINYMQSMALVLGPHNINVNAVAPGLVWTDMTAGTQSQIRDRDPARAGRELRDNFVDVVRRGLPMGEEQTPEDIGNTVSFLCSERARNVHAQTINVDGGKALH